MCSKHSASWPQHRINAFLTKIESYQVLMLGESFSPPTTMVLIFFTTKNLYGNQKIKYKKFINLIFKFIQLNYNNIFFISQQDDYFYITIIKLIMPQLDA